VHSLLLIDDASTDPGTVEYLTDFYARHALALNITLVRHSQNQGFVRTANEGLRRSTRDVVLLNSDTIVTAGWVDKLQKAAYSDWRIATVTPLSNNATICSVPEIAKENELPPGHTVESFGALIDRIALRHYPRLPTAVGFCMYIRRKALDEIGFLDELRFGRGYGEENDFCLRASRQGWIHVLDDATFVYHKGGVSFTDDVKRAEVEKHLAVLDRLYPDYLSMVHQFLAENPLSYLHQHLQFWLRVQGASVQ
jgi:GT2 family glycosyltransferase